MLSKVFVGLSLLSAEWVLYMLIVLSVISVALILERWRFYKSANAGIDEFRTKVRKAAENGNWDDALKASKSRLSSKGSGAPDFESGMAAAVLESKNASSEVKNDLATDVLLKTKVSWDNNLSILATIGSNSPFLGLFGTVLGIIAAFHDLSQQAGTGIQTVTSGISEALVATAVGILVAMPAVVAFNLYKRKVNACLAEAEALKSFLIAKLGK